MHPTHGVWCTPSIYTHHLYTHTPPTLHTPPLLNTHPISPPTESFLALEPLLVGGSLRNAFQPPLIPSSSAASLLPAAMQQPFSSVRPKSDVSMYSTVAAGSTSMTIPPVFPTMSLPLSQQQSASQILYRTNTPTQQQPRLFSNQPLDTTKLANAVASLSWQGGGFRNAPPTVQADTWVVGEPRAPRHTSRSNESPESSEGRHSQGSVPLNGWGHAAGHRIPSSSSSLTGNTNMQVLCMEQPQPGVMCKGANQQGVCVLSVLATQERVGVLLVCGCWGCGMHVVVRMWLVCMWLVCMWCATPGSTCSSTNLMYSTTTATPTTTTITIQVSVPSDPPVCFSIPLEPMLLQPALAPNWIHTELTLLLADASVQKVLHNGRLVGGVLQLLQLSLGARVLDTRVLGLQLHAMYSACETVSPDGVMAAVTMDVEGALVHNGIQVTTPSPAGMWLWLSWLCVFVVVVVVCVSTYMCTYIHYCVSPMYTRTSQHTSTNKAHLNPPFSHPFHPPPSTEITALTIEQQQKPLQWAVCPAMPLQLLTASQEALATLLLAATLRQLVKTTAAGPWAESCSMRYAYGQRIVLNVANDGTSRH